MQDSGNITLIKTSTGWSAKFSGEVEGMIRELFGTDTIPTAFTQAADPKKVQQEIHSKWPRCAVSIQVGESL